jgi:hypothetical protein
VGASDAQAHGLKRGRQPGRQGDAAAVPRLGLAQTTWQGCAAMDRRSHHHLGQKWRWSHPASRIRVHGRRSP